MAWETQGLEISGVILCGASNAEFKAWRINVEIQLFDHASIERLSC